MTYAIICSVAFAASALTFFSGFGLGTLLLPAFALFFALEQAVALTAVVHFLNGAFKLALLWRHVDRTTLVRFGAPAIAAALAGAWLLLRLSEAAPIFEYAVLGRRMQVAPAKLIVGLLLLLFAGAELAPRVRAIALPKRYLPIGGALSGFFGGLAGMQGALRSAFLIKAGLSKEGFVATGAAIGFLIDVSRLGVYASLLRAQRSELDYALLAAAVAAAFAGGALGNRWMQKVTLRSIQVTVAALLLLVAIGLIAGAL